MKCNQCGAPVAGGTVTCEYCGEAVQVMSMAAPGASTGGAFAPMGGLATGQVRALAADGLWYPAGVAAEDASSYTIKFADGTQRQLPRQMVRPPCDPSRLQPGARVLGEYEGRWYPGTVNAAGQDQWNVRFDDGEQAMMTIDRLFCWDFALQPIPPGSQVLGQDEDGLWYPGRIISGADAQGRQRVRFDTGGEMALTRLQINGPAGPELLQVGARVMGLGSDQQLYPATVKQVTQGQAMLTFDDGEEAWLFAHQIRFIW